MMIKVQNIYYMLAYAFQNLNSQEQKNILRKSLNLLRICSLLLFQMLLQSN